MFSRVTYQSYLAIPALAALLLLALAACGGEGPMDSPSAGTTTEAPADRPTSEPGQASSQPTAGAPADQPTSESGQASSQSTAGVPADQPTSEPGQASSQLATEAPEERPTSEPGQTSSQSTAGAPAARPTSEPEPTGDAGGIIPSLGGDGGRAKVEFSSVSARGSHTCGVRRDGSVECWGNNHVGQATPPAGEFSSVSARGGHTCGVRPDGSVACWGSMVFRITPPGG